MNAMNHAASDSSSVPATNGVASTPARSKRWPRAFMAAITAARERASDYSRIRGVEIAARELGSGAKVLDASVQSLKLRERVCGPKAGAPKNKASERRDADQRVLRDACSLCAAANRAHRPLTAGATRHTVQ